MGRPKRGGGGPRGVPEELPEAAALPVASADASSGTPPGTVRPAPLIPVVEDADPATIATTTEPELDAEAEETMRRFVRQALASNTRSAYATDLRQFEAWCREKGRRPFPASPKTVAAWAAHLAGPLGMKYATVERKLAAISSAHTASGAESPCRSHEVRLVLAGVRREKGTKQRQVAAAVAELLEKALETAPRTFRWRRNRAMILLAWAAALRSSELCAIRVEHLTFDAEGRGVILLLPRSKTDQEGRGKTKAVRAIGGSLCPVRALRRWIDKAGVTEGYVFRRVFPGRRLEAPEVRLSRRTVIRLVKATMKSIGLDERSFASHSLRSGFVTTAKARGLTDDQIMKTTGHAKAETLWRYDRPGDPFAASPELLPRKP